jgi:membrane-associated PAP2 superfamily phosphatase
MIDPDVGSAAPLRRVSRATRRESIMPPLPRRVLRFDPPDRVRRPTIAPSVTPLASAEPAAVTRPATTDRFRLLALLVPAALLAVITIIFWNTNLDRWVISLAYSENPANPWPMSRVEPWWFLYQKGPWISISFGAVGAFIGLLSIGLPVLRPYRLAGTFYIFLLLFGPGVLVNLVLKDNLNRPRPHETVEFGGHLQFVPVWGPCAFRNENSSFPSGHAALGFFMIAPAFACFRWNKPLAITLLMAGITWGSLMGIARILQGGHYPSDVIWSAGFVYFMAYGLWALLNLTDRLWARYIDPPVDRLLGWTREETSTPDDTIAFAARTPARRRTDRKRIAA